MDWFRLWHGTSSDPKLKWVARRSGQTVANVLAVWVCLLESASNIAGGEEGVTRGDVAGFDCEAHDALLDVEDGTCARILAALSDKGMIQAGRIDGWERRQPKREDAGDPVTGAKSAAQRKREQRERERASVAGASNDDTQGHGESRGITQCHAMSRDFTTDKRRGELTTPPIPPEGGGAEHSKKRSAITLKTFLAQCREAGEKPIPEGDPVFDYADKSGIPMDYLRIHWDEFKSRYGLPDAKRYKDWRSVYRKSVRGNWFRLWFLRPDGECALTTVGEQARRQHREAA
ncbi:hypothetical protein [Paraburkholderia sp. J63]|uniref:hypothetical protein n=1 Tax=Paraburkholderia sp. J63 TaxID=2805434 RepID=UPI002ABD709B|nr:hypothetical protein [Paraburkholderia sp. J63]